MDWDRQSAADLRFFLAKRIVLDFAMRGTELPRYLVSYPSKQRGDSKIEKFLNLPSRCRSDTEKAAQLQQTAQLVNILAISARFSSTDQTAPNPPPPPSPCPPSRSPANRHAAPAAARRACASHSPSRCACRSAVPRRPQPAAPRLLQPAAPRRTQPAVPRKRQHTAAAPEAKNRSHVERWP